MSLAADLDRQGAMPCPEFRDGNVPAGHEQSRVLKNCLSYLPARVKTVSSRSDTAGYQEALLPYRGEGKDPQGAALPADRSAGTRGQPRPRVDRPPQRQSRGAGKLHLRPSDHQGTGADRPDDPSNPTRRAKCHIAGRPSGREGNPHAIWPHNIAARLVMRADRQMEVTINPRS